MLASDVLGHILGSNTTGNDSANPGGMGVPSAGTNNNTGIITDANGVQRGQIGYGAPYGKNTMFQNVAVANVTQGQPPYLQRQNPVSPTGGASGVSGLAVQPGAAAAPYTTGTNAPSATMPPPLGMTGLGLTPFLKPASDTATGTNAPNGTTPPPQGMTGGLGLTPFLKPVPDTTTGTDQPPATTVPTWPAIPGSALGSTPYSQMPKTGALAATDAASASVGAPFGQASQAQSSLNQVGLNTIAQNAAVAAQRRQPAVPLVSTPSPTTPWWEVIPGSASGGTSGIQNAPDTTKVSSAPGTRAGQAQPDNTNLEGMMGWRDNDTNFPLFPQPDADSQATPPHKPNRPYPNQPEPSWFEALFKSVQQGSLDLAKAGGGVLEQAPYLNIPNMIYNGFTGLDIPNPNKYVGMLGYRLAQWAKNNMPQLNVEPESLKSYAGDTVRGLIQAIPTVALWSKAAPAVALRSNKLLGLLYGAALADGKDYADTHDTLSSTLEGVNSYLTGKIPSSPQGSGPVPWIEKRLVEGAKAYLSEILSGIEHGRPWNDVSDRAKKASVTRAVTTAIMGGSNSGKTGKNTDESKQQGGNEQPDNVTGGTPSK